MGILFAALLGWLAVAITGQLADMNSVGELWSFLTGAVPNKADYPGIGGLIVYILPINAVVLTLMVLYSACVSGPIGLMSNLEIPDIDIDLKAFLLGIIAFPIGEELIFRLLLTGCAIDWFSISSETGIYMVVALSSLLFACIHIPNFRGNLLLRLTKIVYHLLAGFVLAFVYLKFGLLGAIVTHSLQNALALTGSKMAERIMN